MVYISCYTKGTDRQKSFVASQLTSLSNLINFLTSNYYKTASIDLYDTNTDEAVGKLYIYGVAYNDNPNGLRIFNVTLDFTNKGTLSFPITFHGVSFLKNKSISKHIVKTISTNNIEPNIFFNKEYLVLIKNDGGNDGNVFIKVAKYKDNLDKI